MDLAKLEQQVKEANIAYAAGMPFKTDEEYDILWQQLYALDHKNPLLYHTANTYNKVHGKTVHRQQIFGTNKAFNMEDLKPFLTRFGDQLLTIEPKYDGCAAVLSVEKGGLILTLEGDGKSGSDITHLLPYVNVPFAMRNFQAVELILPVADWNPEYGKNPRNVVAGWLARKYEKPGANMTAIPHNFGPLWRDYSYDGDVEGLAELLIATHAEWAKIYPIDGLMIKVKNEKSRLIAGNNGTSNNWSIAWKPPIQIKETTVIDIEWNVSRLGRIIPTVIYEPIDLCGTINSRVTGNNAKWLQDKQIKISSIISVGKAGEIIPKIIEVKNTDVQTFESSFIPNACPTCGETLQWEGVHLVCNGEDCIAKKIVSIAYFYSLKGVKVDGIGESMIEKLLHNESCYDILIAKPWALLDMYSYGLMHNVVTVLGETIFSNIVVEVTEINNTRNMAHFISGLGLPGLSYKSALKLCQYIKTGKLAQNVSVLAIRSFPEAMVTFQTAMKEMELFKFADVPGLAKAKYCITGTLSQSREAIIELMNSYEFEFSSSVTKDLNYLVVGDDAGQTKIKKAIKFNIPQITENQLMNIIKEKHNE